MTFTPCKEWLPGWFYFLGTTGGSNIDATGEMFAYMGRVMFPPGVAGPKDIRKVHFRWGAVTKTSGSALTVSLQNIDAATGPPYRPDGTQDQTVAVANADAGWAANTWYTTGNFSADRTVNQGELLAVVVEFDASGRLGADLFQCAHIAQGNINQVLAPNVANILGAGWVAVQGINNIVLEFSDGTFGTLDFGFTISNGVNLNVNTGTTPDEVALKWVPEFNCKVAGCYVDIASNNGPFDVVLYEGTTPLVTVSMDPQQLRGTGQQLSFVSFDEVTLNASTAYYLAVKPTSGTNVNIQYHEVANAAYWDLMQGGQEMSWGQRTDAGAWSDTATRRPNFGFLISAREYDTGGGGGGGLVANPMGGFIG